MPKSAKGEVQAFPIAFLSAEALVNPETEERIVCVWIDNQGGVHTLAMTVADARELRNAIDECLAIHEPDVMYNSDII